MIRALFWIVVGIGIAVAWKHVHNRCTGCQDRWAAIKGIFSPNANFQPNNSYSQPVTGKKTVLHSEF